MEGSDNLFFWLLENSMDGGFICGRRKACAREEPRDLRKTVGKKRDFHFVSHLGILFLANDIVFLSFLFSSFLIFNFFIYCSYIISLKSRYVYINAFIFNLFNLVLSNIFVLFNLILDLKNVYCSN